MKRLKDMDMKQQRESYKEKNGADARYSDLNHNGFKPLASYIKDYNALIVK